MRRPLLLPCFVQEGREHNLVRQCKPQQNEMAALCVVNEAENAWNFRLIVVVYLPSTPLTLPTLLHVLSMIQATIQAAFRAICVAECFI